MGWDEEHSSAALHFIIKDETDAYEGCNCCIIMQSVKWTCWCYYANCEGAAGSCLISHPAISLGTCALIIPHEAEWREQLNKGGIKKHLTSPTSSWTSREQPRDTGTLWFIGAETGDENSNGSLKKTAAERKVAPRGAQPCLKPSWGEMLRDLRFFPSTTVTSPKSP